MAVKFNPQMFASPKNINIENLTKELSKKLSNLSAKRMERLPKEVQEKAARLSKRIAEQTDIEALKSSVTSKLPKSLAEQIKKFQ